MYNRSENTSHENEKIYIDLILLQVLVVALLRTSGYRYGTFLEIYVHNIRGSDSLSFFAMYFLSNVWVPIPYPFFMY